MQRKTSVNTDNHNQETAEDSGRICCEWWEKYVQITKEDDWIECVSCRNWLYEKNLKMQKRI
jgi:hypothetical protein